MDVSYVRVASADCTATVPVNVAVTSTSAPTVVEGSEKRSCPEDAYAEKENPETSMHTAINAINAFLNFFIVHFPLYS